MSAADISISGQVKNRTGTKQHQLSELSISKLLRHVSAAVSAILGQYHQSEVIISCNRRCISSPRQTQSEFRPDIK